MHNRSDQRSSTVIAIEDAPPSLVRYFEEQFFPELSERSVIANHNDAANRAREKGDSSRAEIHAKYAKAIENHDADLEATAIAEAAIALAAGDYATFLAKGVRFRNESNRRSDSWHQVITAEVEGSEGREFLASSTRSAIATGLNGSPECT